MATVTYEQHIGRRVPGQDGGSEFSVSTSKTRAGTMDETIKPRSTVAAMRSVELAKISVTGTASRPVSVVERGGEEGTHVDSQFGDGRGRPLDDRRDPYLELSLHLERSIGRRRAVRKRFTLLPRRDRSLGNGCGMPDRHAGHVVTRRTEQVGARGTVGDFHPAPARDRVASRRRLTHWLGRARSYERGEAVERPVKSSRR